MGLLNIPQIYRHKVVHNCMHIHGTNELRYSQSQFCVHGYRRDCTGWGAEQFETPLENPGSWHGFNTVTMVADYNGEHYFYPIAARDLRHADVVAIAGPGTEGNNGGHFRIFHKWANDDPNDDSYWAWEQALGSHGPDYTLHDDLADAGHGDYEAYRYTGIVDDPAPEQLPEGTSVYLIKSGDTLSSIADRYGLALKDVISQNLVALDRDAVNRGFDDSDGGNLIFPGTPINLYRTYVREHVVVSGDTLRTIGARYGVAAKTLYAHNQAVIEGEAKRRGKASSMNGHWIYPGTVLVIP